MNWLKADNLSCTERYVFNVALNISSELIKNVSQIFAIFAVLFIKRTWFAFEENYYINSLLYLY